MYNPSAPAAVVAGHICLDITPTFEGDRLLPLHKLISPGRLTRVGAADVHKIGRAHV